MGRRMKILIVTPKAESKTKLKNALKAKERELRGTATAFIRKREGRWAHVKYPGWVNWDEGPGGLLIAEIHTRKEGYEWQLLQSFIGYLDRHVGQQIESIAITYR
jgi:hypothetical protein